MKKTIVLSLIFLLTTFYSIAKSENVITQVSTTGAVCESLYDGVISFADLKKLGDTGIGYFQKMDGEALCIDGKFYHFKADGSAVEAKENEKSPFFTITFFKSSSENFTNRKFNLTQMKEYLRKMLPRKNSIYAIKITGTFAMIKARTFTRQFKPYPAITQVYKGRKEYSFSNIEGTLVGFYTPAFLANINIPGFHFHFISKDRTKGGHLLELKVDSINIEVVESPEINIVIPTDSNFQKADLSKYRKKEISKIEK